MNTICSGLLLFALVGAVEKGKIQPLSSEQLKWNSVKVAAVQCLPSPGEDPADIVVKYINRAAKDGAQLVVFPEYHLGRITIPNESTEKVSAAAQKNSIYVIIGCFENLNEQGEYANNALLFDRSGEIMGRYSKVHAAVGGPPFFWPPYPEDAEWLMEPGGKFPVFDLDFGRVGILTCYDGYFPETFRILALKGAEILVWINGRGGLVEDFMVKSAMYRNFVNMVCTNQAMGAGTMIGQFPTQILACCPEAREDYITGKLDLLHVRTARKHARMFHQRRPELYGGLVKSYPVWDAYKNLQEPPINLVLAANQVHTPLKRKEGMEDGTDLSRISFNIHAHWMLGSIEMRFPEVLLSSRGYHFLDHYRGDIEPLSEFDTFPQWQWDIPTGVLKYDFKTPEGLVFGGSATPTDDEVALEFYARNETGQTISHVDPNCCLNLGTSPDFRHKWDLDHLFMVFDGRYQPLSNTTPTPEQIGRPPWLLMLTPYGKESFPGPQDTGNTWWLVDQLPDENLLAAESQDGKHLVGYTWNESAQTMMSNCGNPCLHTGPRPSPELRPGATYRWYGKIYLMENDPEALLKRYREDQKMWLEMKGEQAGA